MSETASTAKQTDSMTGIFFISTLLIFYIFRSNEEDANRDADSARSREHASHRRGI